MSCDIHLIKITYMKFDTLNKICFCLNFFFKLKTNKKDMNLESIN